MSVGSKFTAPRRANFCPLRGRKKVTNMSKQNQTPPAKPFSIPLPPEGFKPTTTHFRAGSPETPELPANCIEFYNDDEGYRDWCSANPNGWVMNNYRRHHGPIPTHKQNMETVLTIHHVTDHQHHLNRSSTSPYRKLCCAERKPLEDFKRAIIAGTIEFP